jgi:hypothetical protein
MKASEIAAGLAELLAVIGRGDQSQDVSKPAGFEVVDVQQTQPSPQQPTGDVPDKFVPPLQAKIELLKKATGVDNVYDEQDEDEIARMKQMAGIKQPHPIVADEAGSDEPLDI